MVTTTEEHAGTFSQPAQAPPIDDFQSLLAAVPPAKGDALKERIYDWLEKREKDAEAAIVKAEARAAIVKEQNRIVRMELQGVEDGRLRAEAAATRSAGAGLIAEAMSALNGQDPAASREEEDNSEDDHGLFPTDYQQPTDSSATTHALQPLGADIGKKVLAGEIIALDIVIKELLDEVMQLREGASANVARIISLEDQLHGANNELAALHTILDETVTSQKKSYADDWGTETNASQSTSQSASKLEYTSVKTIVPPLKSWEEEEEDSRTLFDPWTKDDAPSPRSWSSPRLTLRNPDPAPIRGYLEDESDGALPEFDACFKEYANMMLMLQLKESGELVAYDEIPWPVLPHIPEHKYPIPCWRARLAEKKHVERFVKGFLASRHAEMWRGSMRDDWSDLLEYTHKDGIREIIENMVSYLG